MPYDKFITDQLAGDEKPYRDEQTLIATGMIRAGTWNDEPNDPADYQYTRLEDMVHTTSSAFIGLTVKRKMSRPQIRSNPPNRLLPFCKRLVRFYWPIRRSIGKGIGGHSSGWTDRVQKSRVASINQW